MFRGIGTRIKCKLTDSRQTQTSHRKRKFKRPVKLTQGSYWTAAPHTSEGAGLENCRGQWGTSCSGFYGNIFKRHQQVTLQSLKFKQWIENLNYLRYWLLIGWLTVGKDLAEHAILTFYFEMIGLNFDVTAKKQTNPNLHILIVHVN